MVILCVIFGWPGMTSCDSYPIWQSEWKHTLVINFLKIWSHYMASLCYSHVLQEPPLTHFHNLLFTVIYSLCGKFTQTRKEIFLNFFFLAFWFWFGREYYLVHGTLLPPKFPELTVWLRQHTPSTEAFLLTQPPYAREWAKLHVFFF